MWKTCNIEKRYIYIDFFCNQPFQITLKKILYQYTCNIGSSQIYKPKKICLRFRDYSFFESKSIVLINDLTREIFIRCLFLCSIVETDMGFYKHERILTTHFSTIYKITMQFYSFFVKVLD